LGSVEPVIPQPKQLAKDMIEFLSTLNVFLQFSMESNQQNQGSVQTSFILEE
jgi:hypothetical protein